VDRILFTIGSLDIGGAEKQMLLLIKQLINRKYSVVVFVLLDNGHLKSDLVKMGVKVVSGGLKKGDMRNKPWKLILSQFKLFRTVRGYRPTIIHSFLPVITFMSALAGRICNTNLVITSRRAMGNHQGRFPLLIPFDLTAHMLSHYITANSRAVQADLVEREHVDKSKTVLIHNGIDLDCFNKAPMVRKQWRNRMGIKDSQKVIICLANLIKYKGHRDFLYAIKEINRLNNTHFWFVGEDRGIRSELESLARQLDIEHRIEFLGTRLDIPELLAASDISVLASHEEGFSNVILESMAAGLPVVATDVGGNGEAVVNGVTGWLVPPKNSGVLAKKIIDLLENPDRAKKMGEQGRARVKAHFSVERLVNQHIALYQSPPGAQIPQISGAKFDSQSKRQLDRPQR